MTAEEAIDLLVTLPAPPQEKVICRVVRGHKAKTTADFFNESAAALQFPPYFGENWDAFEECLTDLEWLRGDVYVLLITNSDQLLEKEPDRQLPLLLKSLEQAGQEWGTPVQGEWPRPARPFHAILQCSKEEEPALRKKLHAAQVVYNHLQ
jgi:hypothetical protein